MDVLNQKGTEDSPAILLDKKNGIFEISGRSLVIDAPSFYKPVFDWIDQYADAPNAITNFCFKLEYYNTSTSKVILDLLNTLQPIKNVKVQWYFHDDDEDMEEEGQDFSELVDIPFEFKTY